ncbi:hypothetical protein MAR_006289 [Mya arenaria]|uniref:B box-type domain-containing protein n=1 Tax=Mya arenaria TaxID=6604 RepID=A0ABY7DA53_MYAAR|nr:hypothetical protein MAR_006289 [Mya arenaria]
MMGQFPVIVLIMNIITLGSDKTAPIDEKFKQFPLNVPMMINIINLTKQSELMKLDKTTPVNEWLEQFPLNVLIMNIIEEGTRNGDATVTQHKCSLHENKDAQMYCFDDNEYGCLPCSRTKHMCCERIVFLNDEDQLIEVSNKVLNEVVGVKEDISQTIEQMGSIIDNVALESDAIIEHVRIFKLEMERLLHQLCEKVISDVDEKRNTEVKRIDKFRNKYRVQFVDLNSAESLLQYHINGDLDNGDLLVALQQSISVVSELQTEMKYDKEPIPMTLKWTASELVDHIKKDMEELLQKPVLAIDSHNLEPDKDNQALDIVADATERNGKKEISTSLNDSNTYRSELVSSDYASESLSLSTISTINEEQPMWFRKAEIIGLIKPRTKSIDKYDCDITACLVTQDDEFFLVDHNNNNIKQFAGESGEFKFKQHRRFTARPWGAAAWNSSGEERIVAISFPHVQSIACLDFNNSSSKLRSVKIQHSCYGIAIFHDSLIATTYDDGHYVLFLKEDCSITRKISLADSGNPTIMRPISVLHNTIDDNIIVTTEGHSSANGSILYIDAVGNIVDTVTTAKIKRCFSCDYDKDGNLYICDRKSSTVFVKSKLGDALKSLLTSKHGINQPCCLRFLQGRVKFVVADESSSVKLFCLNEII